MLSHYVVEGFLGDYPREDFVGAFDAFTGGAAVSAARDIDLLTANRYRDASSVRADPARRPPLLPRRRLGRGRGVGRGATSSSRPSSRRGGRPRSRSPVGSCSRRTQGSWSIFGYDVARDDAGRSTRRPRHDGPSTLAVRRPTGAPARAGRAGSCRRRRRAPGDVQPHRGGDRQGVDFSDGVVWILALGSDARPGQDVLEGNTDAIQLVGLDLASGRAAGLGIPRDSWLEIPGDGLDRINQAMSHGRDRTSRPSRRGPRRHPAGLRVRGRVRRVQGHGRHRSAGSTCTRTARSATTSSTSTYVKGATTSTAPRPWTTRAPGSCPTATSPGSANQQEMMLGILAALRAHEDEAGFMERGDAVGPLRPHTDLGPTELYRLAQAITLIRPDRVETCVLTGDRRDDRRGCARWSFLDEAQVRQIGADVRGRPAVRRRVLRASTRARPRGP